MGALRCHLPSDTVPDKYFKITLNLNQRITPCPYSQGIVPSVCSLILVVGPWVAEEEQKAKSLNLQPYGSKMKRWNKVGVS